MKFCRFKPAASHAAEARYGILHGDRIREISAAPWNAWSETEKVWANGEARLVAPVEPRKIVCIGRNYLAHAKELGNEVPENPLIFLKPASAIVGPDEAIVLPRYSKRVEHEGELGLVVGKRCSHLGDEEDSLSYLLGYTCVNDVTARDLQKADVQFTRAKGFDTFCPLGPWIETKLDPNDLHISTRVNGATKQDARTDAMLFPVARIVSHISQFATLAPGDVILTGTPEGVGPLQVGDTVEVELEGIGVLRNHLVAEA